MIINFVGLIIRLAAARAARLVILFGKRERRPGAAGNTFAACQAMAIVDWLTLPGIAPDVDVDRTIL